MTKTIKIGGRVIGGGSPVLIQSMTNTDTADVDATTAQINALAGAGCEIIRVAAYDIASARAIKTIKKSISIPIVADVHFDYKIAIAAVEAGADKIRINPGNIGGRDKIRSVVDAAKSAGIPIRVGANSGSLHKDYASFTISEALVRSALENIRALEEMGFYDIVVSLKASNTAHMIRAYRRMNSICDYPLHLGVTEAGTERAAIIKSAIGIGSLLIDGIGDTVRVSITGDPIKEIAAAKDILKYCGARSFGPEIISCPTCGRTRINVEKMALAVEDIVKHIDKPLKIAVMGCAVNGPGEARDADIGIAGGNGEGLLFVKGVPLKKVPEDELITEFDILLNSILNDCEK